MMKKIGSRGTKGPSILGYPRFLNSKDRLHATAKNEYVAIPLAAEAVPVAAPPVADPVEVRDATWTDGDRPRGREPEVVQFGRKVLAVLVDKLPILVRFDDVAIVHPPDCFGACDVVFVLEKADGLELLTAEFKGDADVSVTACFMFL